MKPADIYLLIIPIHYKLSTAQIKEMVEAAGIEELQTLVSQTRYGRQYHFSEKIRTWNRCIPSVCITFI